MAAITARTNEGNDVTLEPSVVEAFAASLRGPVLQPGSPEHEESGSVWNGMIARRPALVARCLGVADVQTSLKFAKEHGLALSVKGGGHNVAGLAVPEQGLMLDLSLMKGVFVDPENRSARAQAGCLLGDVDRETQVHGLAAVLGFVSNTGIAGLTLGGGFGYLTRRFGWTTDNLNAVELVTADGRVVRASEKENADLFWGLRGGGGNFGVATSFDYKLHPVGPEIMAGAIAWRLDEAPAVLEYYRDLADNGPAELSIIAGIRNAPPAPWIDADVHGKPIVAFFVCHTGSVEAGEKDVAPIKGFGKPVGDVVQRRPYAQQQALIDATQPKGRRYYWKSEYLPGISKELTDKAIEHAGKLVSPHSAILMAPLAGPLNDLPEDHSAVGNRDARAIFNIAGGWDDAGADDDNMGWVRDTWSGLKQFSTGGTYVNFLPEGEDEDRTRAAYRGNYDRLVELKRKWDPDNVFRVNKNIAP